jgi:hypothetical protein
MWMRSRNARAGGRSCSSYFPCDDLRPEGYLTLADKLFFKFRRFKKYLFSFGMIHINGD